MAIAETARLIAQLTLDDKLSPGLKKAGGNVGTFEKSINRAGQGLKTFGRNAAVIGAGVAGGLATQVIAGVHSLEDLDRVMNATNGVIKSTGGAAGVTAEQVRSLADELENVTTVDDKTVQEAENLLLTFTNIGEDVFPTATKAVVDLGVAMADGDVANADFGSSAIQIGKALNDPIKGITALTRVGVTFTDQQKKQIAALEKAGDVAGAQKIILQELEREFGEAGKAAGTGFGADMRRVGDAIEGAQQALARGFLPLITRVSKILNEKLSDPNTLKAIEGLGEGLADALSNVIDAAEKIPWAAIGDALQIGGMGAKAILDAFVALPPWVQTAVLTGWGLNKLTGGALGDIAGTLATSFIKGVLGINAGVVNINAATVNGGGGPGGVGGAVGGGLSLLQSVTIAGIALGAAEVIGTAIVEKTGGPTGGAGREVSPGIIVGQSQAAAAHGATPVHDEKLNASFDTGARKSSQADVRSAERLEQIEREQARTRAQAITDSRSEQTAIQRNAQMVAAAQDRTRTATEAARNAINRVRDGTSEVAQAVRNKKLSVTNNVAVNVQNKVWVGETLKAQTTFKKTGGFIAR